MNLNYLFLENTYIYDQLHLEEFFLREKKENYCLVNVGSKPALVMGVSGKADEWIDVARAKKNNIPIIKRFSGGGTVFVDAQTVFISFIFNESLFDFKPFPEPIHRWAESLYQDVFTMKGFSLKENDYVIGEKKFGGNAQYIRKNRWLHHTTFLWDFEQKNMDYLIFPPKTPSYRQGRSHDQFLCTLNQFFPDKQSIVTAFENVLQKNFQVKKIQIPSDFKSGNGRSQLI